MKHFTTILSLALIFLLLSGCHSNETRTAVDEDGNKVKEKETVENNEDIIEEDLVSKLMNYETITLEDSEDNHQINIEYPKFNYAPLDEMIHSDHEKTFKGQIEQAKEFSLDDYAQDSPYSYSSTFDEPIITENFVSIYFEGRVYQGGGNSFSYTMNFDLKNERLITLDDILKEHSTSLEVIADLVSKKLIHDERFSEYREDPVTEQYKMDVREETTPEESNYSSFTLSDDSITFYKQYYSLFPNSEGIVGVEITWDEIENYTISERANDQTTVSVHYEFGDPVEPLSTLQYVDEDYGFSLTLPESWKDSYLVHELTLTENYVTPVEPSKVVAFSMVEDGMFIGDAFYIEVLEDVSEEEAKAYYSEGDFGGFVAMGNGVVLTYSWIGQMPEPLYEEPYIETGNQFAKMIQDDRPIVLETVEFQ